MAKQKNLQLPALPPRLPAAALRELVENYLCRRKNFLAAHRKIASSSTSSAWVFDREMLDAAAGRFREAFNREFSDVDFFYALKCNPHPQILTSLTDCAWSLDASSGDELTLALGTSAPQILLSGPGKTENELQMAAANGERVCIIADSFAEIARLKKNSAGTKKIVMGVRITASTRWKKFGVSLTDLPEVYREIRRANLDFRGLQFHTSWNLNPAAPVEMLKKIGRALAKMPTEFIAEIRFIDCGGGYWSSRGEWLNHAGTARGAITAAMEISDAPFDNPLRHYYFPVSPIENFAREMAAAFQKFVAPIFRRARLSPPKIYLEPGRYLATPSMHLLLTVIDRKNPRLVITDAGTNARGLDDVPAVYAPIINLTRPSFRERRADILGALCTPHDCWGASYFGESIEVGDVLLIPEQGAYTYTLRQTFIKPLLPTVSV